MTSSVHRGLLGGVLLALVAGALFLDGLGRSPLLDPDEARHAEVAREIFDARGVRGRLLPTLDYRPYSEKPPAYYWLVALAYRARGVDEAGARTVSALAALVAVVAIYAYALPRFGTAGALAAGLVTATSGGWLALSRYANLDMTLTALVTVGVLAGLAWLERPAPRRPPLLTYVAAGLGMLVKGPIAGVLVGGPLVLAALARRTRPAWRELGVARGLAIVLGLAAAVYVPVALLDRSYVTGFATTNVRRWATTAPHAAPPYYYALWLPALLLPWTALAVPATVAAWRDPARRPLVLWAAFVPGFLTLPRGKLATYALSALVPLGLIVGTELARFVRADATDAARPFARVTGWVAAAALAAGAVAVLVMRAYPVPAAARGALFLAAAAWAIGLVVLLRRDLLEAVPVALVGALLTIAPVAVHGVVPAVAALHSERDAARVIAAAPPAPVIAFAIRDPSLSFYLRAAIVYTSDRDLVRDVFADPGLAFLVTSRAHFAEVEEALGDTAHVWHATRRRRVYANRPPPNGSM